MRRTANEIERGRPKIIIWDAEVPTRKKFRWRVYCLLLNIESLEIFWITSRCLSNRADICSVRRSIPERYRYSALQENRS